MIVKFPKDIQIQSVFSESLPLEWVEAYVLRIFRAGQPYNSFECFTEDLGHSLKESSLTLQSERVYFLILNNKRLLSVKLPSLIELIGILQNNFFQP